jgi:hypothetical protein
MQDNTILHTSFFGCGLLKSFWKYIVQEKVPRPTVMPLSLRFVLSLTLYSLSSV